MTALVILASLAAAPLQPAMTARGIPADEVVVAFAPHPAIETFAKTVVAGHEAEVDRAVALYNAILKLKHSGKIEGDRDNSPKARSPKTAIQLMALAEADDARDRKAGCYELAALYVSAARSVGLNAVGVERAASVGTGQIGHVMAGVRYGAQGRLHIFDLQNEKRGGSQPVVELDDVQFAAHHYNHLAVAAHLNGRAAPARRAIDHALLLSPDSASFLNNRATIGAHTGELDAAIADALHAVSLQPSVPLYRYQLGRLNLAAGYLADAAASLRAALQLRSSYGMARRDLGWTLLLLGQADAAGVELQRVVRNYGTTPDADLYLSLYFLAQGKRSKAMQAAQAGLRRNAEDAQLRAVETMVRNPNSTDDAVGRLRRVLASVPKE